MPSPFARPLPRVIAVANQKGGVGKTTTAVNLGACLAELGYRVLVVDLDPQGNATHRARASTPATWQSSMYDVILHDLPLEDCIEATSVRNLFVAPASLDLAGAEIELVPAFSRELRLRAGPRGGRSTTTTSSSSTARRRSACSPSTAWPPPARCSSRSSASTTPSRVWASCCATSAWSSGTSTRRSRSAPSSCVMYDARTKLADQVVQEVRDHFGDKVCRTVVPRTVRLSEAPSFGQPIIAFDPTSRGRHRLPGAGQGGERWRAAADWVGGSGR